MANITITQARQRFASLPEVLQDAMFSQKNSKVISAISEQNHLTDERAADVAKAVGWVFLGFVHPEDLAKEIRDSAGVDYKVASGIADYIDSKIFQPIRNDLEQAYAPAPKEEKAGPPKPVPMEEIKKPEAAIPIPQTPISTPMGQVGPLSTPFPAPKAALGAVPLAKTPAAAPSAPVPFILHQESELQTAPVRAGFKIGFGEEQFGKTEQKWTPPPRPAQIETSPFPKPQETRKEERVIHYNTEMRTPIPPVPAAKAEVPAPPAPPKPPVPPSAPGAATPAQRTPINPFGVFNSSAPKFPPPQK